ncbi:hypothetical protein OS31_20960 [Dickeya oryzae]
MVLGKPQTDPTLEWFLSHCHIHKYPSKSTLIHQGEKAETLYYIVKGSVAVLIKDEEGKEMILSYLNQGDFIGELGLFEDGQERSAWVRAKTACEVAEISYKKIPPAHPGQPGHSDALVLTDGTSSAGYFAKSRQPGVPRRDGPHRANPA